MESKRVLRVKEPSVCHEAIDGEVVVVDFDSGDYYSLTGSAARVWAVLAEGASIGQVWSRLRLGDAGSRQRVADFIERLCAAGLIEATGDEATDSEQPCESGPADFPEPVMEKFSDMQELLMADPLHDVDEDGWPNRRPDPAA